MKPVSAAAEPKSSASGFASGRHRPSGKCASGLKLRWRRESDSKISKLLDDFAFQSPSIPSSPRIRHQFLLGMAALYGPLDRRRLSAQKRLSSPTCSKVDMRLHRKWPVRHHSENLFKTFAWPDWRQRDALVSASEQTQNPRGYSVRRKLASH